MKSQLAQPSNTVTGMEGFAGKISAKFKGPRARLRRFQSENRE
jgi:hypothetical protein